MNAITEYQGMKFDDLLAVGNTELLQNITTAGLSSKRSKVSYGVEIRQFVEWFDSTGAGKLSPLALDAYKDYLQDQGYSPAKINLALSAIRRMIKQAARNEMLSRSRAADLRSVEGVRSEGVRMGNWLTRDQAQALLYLPNTKQLIGLRDRAILAVFLGAGLRRSELVSMTMDHIQQREGRWVIVDIKGKRGKTRSVPIAPWVKHAIDQWTRAAEITTGVIFRRMLKGGIVTDDPMTSQATYNLVKRYCDRFGVDIAPHDLRRTFSKLAYMNGKGASIDQISLTLGHESVRTTQDYLGLELDLQNAASDKIDLRINGE